MTPSAASRMLTRALHGALCAECKRPLGGAGQAIFHAHDTTKRTVHWDCRSENDDPSVQSNREVQNAQA